MGREASVSTLAAALLAALGIAPLATQAATIIVTTTGDAVADPGCTLRNAIASMNTGAVAGNCVNTGAAFGTNDTINFDAAAFPGSGANTIALVGGQLSITDYELAIDASANGGVTIDAHQASRVMYANGNSNNNFGSLTLSHLTLRNGLAPADFYGYSVGGGVSTPHANLTLNSSTLSGNSAAYGGGGIFSIFGGITLTNSTLIGNTTAGKGGGVFSSFHTGSVTLSHSTLSGNSALSGGGIYSGASPVTLTASTLSGNSATNGKGGGINSYASTVTLTNSTLSDNSAGGGKGGGIYSQQASFTLTNCTLNGNSADAGGGIYSNTGRVTLTNSTLSGNSATNGRGGGIYAKSNLGYLTLTHATVSANSATSYGGGVVAGAVSTVNNSIVAGNTQGSGPDLIPGFASGTNNLFNSGDPLLGALADNGGPTQTMLPQPGSPAINAAPCLAGIDTDQRGYIRPDPPSRNQALPCDIGAVEADSIPLSDEIFFNGFEQ